MLALTAVTVCRIVDFVKFSALLQMNADVRAEEVGLPSFIISLWGEELPSMNYQSQVQ